MEFSLVMSSTLGRSIRILAGLALVIAGLAIGGRWYVLAIVGLAPVLAGAMNVCLLAPLVGGHLRVHRG